MTETRNGAANRRCQSIRNVNKISLVGGTHPEVGYFHPRQFLTLFISARSPSAVVGSCLESLLVALCPWHVHHQRHSAGSSSQTWRGQAAMNSNLEPTQNGANRSKGGFCVACHGCAVSRLESPPSFRAVLPDLGRVPPVAPRPSITHWHTVSSAPAVSESPTVTWVGFRLPRCRRRRSIPHQYAKAPWNTTHTCATNDLSDRSLPTRFRLSGPRLFCPCAACSFQQF